MSKFFEWFGRNRQPVGYTIGGLNLLAALSYYLQGQSGLAMLWMVIGMFLIWDAADFK